MTNYFKIKSDLESNLESDLESNGYGNYCIIDSDEYIFKLEDNYIKKKIQNNQNNHYNHIYKNYINVACSCTTMVCICLSTYLCKRYLL